MSEQTGEAGTDLEREEQAIRQTLIKKFRWSDESIALGLNAKFKCEYCGTYLLENVEAFKNWTTDHIVPKCKEGPEERHNWALAWRTCNLFKRNFNPTEGKTSSQREDLIARSWDHIRGKRDGLTKALENQKELLGKLIRLREQIVNQRRPKGK